MCGQGRHANEVQLGSEAYEYLRKSLSKGQTLAQYLLNRTDLEAGSIVALLSGDAHTDALTEFETGGKLVQPPPETHLVVTADDGTQVRAVPIPTSDRVLISLIHDFLASGPETVCIFQDAVAVPTDPWPASVLPQLFFVDNEVYHMLRGQSATHDLIQRTLSETTSFDPPTLAVLTRTLGPGPLSEPSRNLLSSFSERAHSIVVGAYDGEGYVVWRR